ncbi:MAG: hypothetical protein AMS22_14645 [Thiotrichales bacterium SG8_50]|jgi:hypothetical protein|nr:MAG: hypothetical protein AMS22_14645 [Thiotrichales bacterium SG8_50]
MKLLRLFVEFSLVLAGVVSTVGCSRNDDPVFEGLFGPPQVPQPAPPPPDWVDITVVNGQDVAAAVVRAVSQEFAITSKIAGQVFPNPPAAPDLFTHNSKFELFATMAMTGTPATEPCAMSGTVTVSGPFGAAGNDPLTLEDNKYDLVFDACDDGDGYNIDGAFSIIVDEVNGDPRTDVFRLLYSVSYMDLTVASGVETYTAEDDVFIIEWDSLAFPVIALSNMPVYLRLSSQADVYSWTYGEQSLTMNADNSIPATLGEVRKSLVDSASLGGYLSYETIVPLQAPDGQDPHSGEILVSEYLGNGTIRIVIESSDTVRLDIDADGDGSVDDFQYTTWTALRG